MSDTSKTFDYENIWQGGWNDATKYGPACRHRRRIVANLVRSLPHGKVLDLGCGDGCLLSEIAPKIDAEFHGADISAAAIESARKSVPGVTFQVLDLSTGIPTGTYDIVILSEVLEHIEDDETLLKKIAPITRHIVISVPGGPADKVDTRYGHFRNYDGDLLQRKLESSGYDVVKFRRWGFPFYELTQALMNECADATAVAGGSYGPMKKLIAQVVYLGFFLNAFPKGSQVFAVGRSRTFKG